MILEVRRNPQVRTESSAPTFEWAYNYCFYIREADPVLLAWMGLYYYGHSAVI